MPNNRGSLVFQLFVSFVGINVCYLYYGVVQERLHRNKFDNTLFLFGAQCLTNALFALAGTTLLGSNQGKKPLSEVSKLSPLSKIQHMIRVDGYRWLGFVSLSYLLAMLCSNDALRYVSYPAQALAKSCKMVPVMLGNVLVGVKYGVREYLTVGLITLGVALFQMTSGDGGKKSKDSTAFGYVLLFISLILDGITGSHQQLLDQEYGLSAHDLMLGMNVFAFSFTAIALVLTGEGERGLSYMWAHPEVQNDIALFAIASALGQNFIFYTITGPGSLACTMITTTRKFFTICISVLLYDDNILSFQQWLGVACVFLGLVLEIGQKIEHDRHRKQ